MSDGKKSAAKEIIENENAGRLEYVKARKLAYSEASEMDAVVKLTTEALETLKSSHSADAKKRAAMTAGVGLWIQQKYAEAAEAFNAAGGSAEAEYLRALCQIEIKDYAGAIKSLQRAAKAGQDEFACAMAEAEALRLSGNREEALARIRQYQKAHDQDAELHYQKGRCLEEAHDIEPAMAAYERAVELDSELVPALFRLAYWNDLRGNDDVALSYYEKASEVPPARRNVLQNLGVMYEDRGEYEKAAEAYSRILAANPTDETAKMYRKDAMSSQDMFYDEATERKQHRTAALLRVPLSEFELSARCRACLEKMNIRTLGDLARLDEDDITESKNFGETSLAELRELLESKGLHFGMGQADVNRPAAALTPAEDGVFNKPVAELDLSIRSLKCVRSVGCETVGDLIGKSDKELLACANFGQTSLMEIKRKLAALGLSLKTRE